MLNFARQYLCVGIGASSKASPIDITIRCAAALFCGTSYSSTLHYTTPSPAIKSANQAVAALLQKYLAMPYLPNKYRTVLSVFHTDYRRLHRLTIR